MPEMTWATFPLGEVITLQRGFDITKADQRDGPFWVISSSGPKSTHERYMVNGPGVVIGRKGTLGSVYFSEAAFWPHDTTLWVRDFHGNDPKFTYFFLQTMRFERYDAGASNPTLNRNHAHAIPVRWPKSVHEQRRIASILSAYDDLIENCQRRIRLLEDMARGLYREWFVHFRFPGAEALPRVDSPLGPIPQGWPVRQLEELMLAHIGGGWGKDSPEDNQTEPAWVIRGTDIPSARASQVNGVPYRFHSKSNLRSRRLADGDIIFEVSGGSKGQPVGRTLIVTQALRRALGNHDVICASFCKRVQPDINQYGAELLYLSLQEGYESGEIEQYQVQSTGISNFKWMDYIQQTLRVVPTADLRVRFRDQVSPLLAQIGTLGLKITNLRRTRDLLLPRLLSGQIDVGVAESMAGAEATEPAAAA